MESNRLRLCMTDLFHRELVDMVERETRRFSIELIESPDDPDFPAAFKLMWDAFGPQGEMEREEAIRGFLLDDPHEPTASGTFVRYFLLVAKDREGNICGVRDGCVLYNEAYATDLSVVYLSRIFMLPAARGTALSLWLRIAPIEIAVSYLHALHTAGSITLPRPDAPAAYFGMRLTLTAEMEYFTPEDRRSLSRILFYGRGGFAAINPDHFPYAQPDVRDPELIRATGSQALPFMILVRRMGREDEATMPIDEARAMMQLLYDDFVCQVAPEHLEQSLAHAARRLEERAKSQDFAELLPLPTGRHNLDRLRALFRKHVLATHYRHVVPLDEEAGQDPADNPRWLDDELSQIARDLAARPRPRVYRRRRAPRAAKR